MIPNSVQTHNAWACHDYIIHFTTTSHCDSRRATCRVCHKPLVSAEHREAPGHYGWITALHIVEWP